MSENLEKKEKKKNSTTQIQTKTEKQQILTIETMDATALKMFLTVL